MKVQEEAKQSQGYVMDPRLIQGIYRKLEELIQKTTAGGYQPVILCSPAIRLTFRRVTERLSSKLMILSYNELIPEAQIHSIGVVDMVQ
jgi:flagellar biosynthesis protein FlhA